MGKCLFFYFLFFLRLLSQDCRECLDSIPPAGTVSEYIPLSAYCAGDEKGRFHVSLMYDKNTFYIKIRTPEILYFGVRNDLEVISDPMSIVFKNVEQKKHSSQEGYFVLEAKKNYIVTLKNYGITEIRFNKNTQKISKKEVKQIKKAAECILQKTENKN